MKKSLVRLIGIILCLTSFASAQDPEETLLTLEKIFKDKEFDAESFGKVQWLNEGNSYTPIDKKKYKSKDIDEFDTETGIKKVILAAGKLIPEGKNNALELYSYQWSGDKRYILIFTNTKKVWRYHTRGDYWIYDIRTEKLWQLGSKFPTSTLMFAEFSPDDDQVAYVCQNNIYVENLTDQRIRQLTKDGSGTIINGTFDWVYEEEFHLRKGFRWSPDSEHIAFWR
ncbi:DPP IV N-terminal domain-containing protein, partial [bacterium]|nr:DPP IV N-terminal domain-containing protein [bacterium]